MEKKITYRNETANNVMVCRELCNRLMEHQASKTKSDIYKNVLSSMCFENRLLSSFETTDEKLLIVAYDGNTPVGYVYATAESVTAQNWDIRPAWASSFSSETKWLFPDWLQLPEKIGDFNNLYVLPEYRGLGIGKHLTDLAMNWLHTLPGTNWLFVYVSNGNNVAEFYESYGFRFSHPVLGGLITAYCQESKRLTETTV